MYPVKMIDTSSGDKEYGCSFECSPECSCNVVEHAMPLQSGAHWARVCSLSVKEWHKTIQNARAQPCGLLFSSFLFCRSVYGKPQDMQYQPAHESALFNLLSERQKCETIYRRKTLVRGEVQWKYSEMWQYVNPKKVRGFCFSPTCPL